jgi:hypothetical protein
MSLQLIDLLTKGYLPIELPPPFTAAQYAQELAGPTAALPGGAAASQPRFSTACVHNLVRTGGLRRNLGIPNPKHFYRLAEHVTVNWANLTACANASPFSMSKPTADGRFERAISPEHDLAERTAKREIMLR